MRCSSAFTILAIVLCSCASLKAPVRYPATLAVDWHEQLNCLSDETRDRMVRGVLRAEADAAKRVIECKADRDAMKIERDSAKASAEADRTWAVVGRVETLGIVVGAIAVITAVVVNAFGETK